MNKINLAGCVFIKDNKILLIKRIKTGWYELPGGKIDENETTEQAAIREIKEELLADIVIVRKIGEADFNQGEHTMGYTWFLADFMPGQVPKVGEPDKFEEVRYIAVDDMHNNKLSPNMENFIQLYKDQKITI
jgi:8-oxo-dGTP pyrophosphatase MutT (NUDIX family)